MKRNLLMAVSLALSSFSISAAHADILFDNPISMTAGANCAFNTTCASLYGYQGDYAAQQFNLAGAAIVQSGSISTWDQGALATSVNWQILSANGASGLPGTVLASGTSSIISSTYLGQSGGGYAPYNVDKNAFNIGSVSLSAGSYYFAVQAISANSENYLGVNPASSGAAEYLNGTWHSNYQGYSSVAVGLEGTLVTAVPEPTDGALMLSGMGLLGFVASRRKKQDNA